MPAFQAINLEPEENVDEQIDTTKELQVDEALKRFQNALKLHAQGLRSREAASAAYDELFESEIFKYREAKTDYERAELQADGQPETSAPESFAEGLDVAAGGADGVAASLALALYLSYKNYGQFYLDKLKDEQSSSPDWGSRLQVYYRSDQGKKVLDSWMAALDQDPSDPELWRKMARFAGAMNSGRLKRYCLEAAIELDDDPAIMEVEPPSLAESLAGEQLKMYLNLLGDDMALSHPAMAPWLKKKLPLLLKRHLDPIPFLPDPTSTLSVPVELQNSSKLLLKDSADETASVSSDLQTANKNVESWSDLGFELMKCAENTKDALEVCRLILQTAKQDTDMDEPQRDEATDQPRNKASLGSKKSKDRNDNKEKKSATPPLDSKGSQASDVADDTAKGSDTAQKELSVSQSARKRSQSVAGLPDGADEENVTEKRSKRVRRRAETTQAEEAPDPSTLIANQLRPFQEADQHLFTMAKNMLETIGVEDKQTFEYLDEILNLCVADDRLSKFTCVGAKDLRTLIVDFKEDVAMVFLNKKEQATLGLSSFLEHAKTGSQDQAVNLPFNEAKGLRDFAQGVEKRHEQMTSHDIAFEWMRAISPSYASFKWPDVMKTAVVQMLNTTDSSLYGRVSEELRENPSSEVLADLESLIPMIFELYIDIYERITNPSSAVDYATRMETKYRLQRWLDLTSAYVRLMDRPAADPLCVRFLWASVMVSSLSDNPVREHILLLWTSLRDFLAEEEVDTITLPNNVVMPTISPAAADREISKLTTMDFFLSLFQEGMESPVHVIETLEPVLNPSSVCISVEDQDDATDSDASSTSDMEHQKNKQRISDCATQGMRDLWKFLRSSSTELRLFLWSRLGDAYEAIKYTTKRFSCYLRSIELIVADLENEKYAKLPDESRLLLYMRTLKSLDELLIQALTLALNDNSAFDIIDDDHLKSSCSAIAKVNSILHAAFLCEDEIKVGAKTAPSSNSTFQSLITKLREMQVRTWCLQYTMFRAALPLQESIAPEKDLADFLAAIHQVIGLRKCCKASNKIFLKVMRMELLKNKNIENWEDYLGQVVYDLYGLKLGVGVWEVQDHGCPHEKLEKRQTMQLVEKVMILANRMSMKDLLKSDLKTAIEHMQQTIGQPKSTPQMIHNLRNFTELVKKPIHPLRLYQALVGEVSVDAVSTNTPEAALAKHGWFFLLGMIALTKFKAVDLNRRQTPGATDDLRIGATFLRLQLQFSSDNWESWFRLAECFDYDLDEAVLWTADKMNKDRAELVKFQRNAIHCYTLALSHSRYLEVEANDEDPLHDLYHKFGMRLYASSREPFAMEPFQHSDQERFFIQNMGAGTFKRILHEQMTEYKVWKFAAKLFRMAIERKPGNWKNPYMLAKCYWKMYQTPEEELDSKDKDTRIGVNTVLKALKDAVSVAYNARKSRSSDPILEPHYKIVSIVHKLVMRGDLPAKEAAELLSEQPFGVQFKADDIFASFTEPEDWEEYIIPSLVKLKEKDKSNWQHRIVARHARILFDETSLEQVNDIKVAAQAAFAILRENMFTKTMVMNVWKCDAERPGRHHVFTEQYVRFMTKLLVVMSDKTNLEQLLRRLRKKGADFYHFVDLWQSCCNAYLKLLREAHDIPHPTDDAFKALSTEEFEIMSERITDWAAREEANIPAFNCMKEAIELKKLNANLMKAAGIDDLINDCYSKIYVDVAGTLPGQEPSKIIEERNQAKEIAAKLEAAAAAQADSKPNSSLSNILNPPSTHDSLPGTATPLEGEKSEAAPRTRKSGVRRPDILRKAEQAVTRSIETPKSVHPRSRVGSMSSGKRGSQTPNAGASDAESDEEGPDAQVRREAGEDTDMPDTHVYEEDGHDGHDDSKMEDKEELESDEAHSLDDSADESDLSDVPDDYEEDVPPSLMFPHLGRTIQSGETSGEDADSESEGDEHEDEEEEDEDEEHGEDEAEEAEEGEEEHEGGDHSKDHEDGEDEDEDEEEGDEHGEDTEMAEPHTPRRADADDSIEMGT
ncbi:histone transcription regulator 3 [Trichoderma arundinaceum]|uniref:Histone transcription regulator 3 homolog n=1 Tax=Trichoderma arundinaceum TaxID=490622 RepID=A0A395NBD0_TRIAR|nr:histone transcription regulator 3 [Trichoderma arundinaceum]